MYKKKIIGTFAIVGILYSCGKPTPEDNARKSVETYLLDSLKNQKVVVNDFIAFDTITKHDSLVNKLKVLDEEILYGNAELKKAIANKESYASISELAGLFSNGNNNNEVDANNENLNSTIKNLKIGLAFRERDKKEISSKLTDDKLKKIVSTYRVECRYTFNADTLNEVFVLNPQFKVIQNLK
jgi:hypothetical protein